jgi:Disordered region of unknown function (DUF5315)
MPSPTDQRLEVPTSTTSSKRPNLKTTVSQRLPPPSLFQGPPSRNASHISLAMPSAQPTTSNPPSQPHASRIPLASSFAGPLPGLSGKATGFSTSPLSQRAGTNANNNADHADALWAEMQNTLAEVELSAMNSSHVFGATHARALEDLRTSQLALAQAWAKSEADEMGDAKNDLNFASKGAEVSIGPSLAGPKSQQSKKGELAKESRRDLEEETEHDILLARKRREANDRYFHQVNNGVLDVVGKLEEVAAAMRRVERESREIWSDSDSGGGSATDVTDTDATNLTASPG